MGTLDTYLAGPGAKTLTALADEIGVSKARLSQLRNSKDWPPALAMKIEEATGGNLDAGMLCAVVALARKSAA